MRRRDFAVGPVARGCNATGVGARDGKAASHRDVGEIWRRMADDVHQILSGAKPEEIPIYQPAKYNLAINLKTAVGFLIIGTRILRTETAASTSAPFRV